MINLKLLASVMLLSSVTMSAAGFRSMVIETADGNDVTVNLSTELSTTFSDGDMHLRDSYVDVSVPMANVLGWRYSNNVYDAVDMATADESAVEHHGDYVEIKGLKPGSMVALVTIDGREVLRDKASETYRVSLSGLTNGVYVLTVNNQSYKIAVNR